MKNSKLPFEEFKAQVIFTILKSNEEAYLFMHERRKVENRKNLEMDEKR